MAPSESISSRIKTSIASWRTSRGKPPYRYEQLIAMAMLVERCPITTEEIFQWINEIFPYYGRKVSEAFWESNQSQTFPTTSTAVISVENLQREIHSVLQSFEFPSYREGNGCGKWRIKVYQARELLRTVLDTRRVPENAELSLFDLPAELRNVVYSMVFQYPVEPGLTLRANSRRFEMHLRQVEQSNGQILGYKTSSTTRPMARILDPLLTCRQFFKEATPFFYRLNHSHVHDIRGLNDLLSKLLPSRRRHLSHFSFGYPRRDRVIAQSTFELLTQVQHLRILNIRIEESTWLKVNRGHAEKQAIRDGKDPGAAKAKYRSALDMPGMTLLRSIRGLEEVSVTGIRKESVLTYTVETLKADLTRPKRASAAPKAAKRKHQLEGDLVELHDRDERLKAAIASMRDELR